MYKASATLDSNLLLRQFHLCQVPVVFLDRHQETTIVVESDVNEIMALILALQLGISIGREMYPVI